MFLDGTKSSLNEIKTSHTKNETAYCDVHIQNFPRLDHYLVESAEVNFPPVSHKYLTFVFQVRPFDRVFL